MIEFRLFGQIDLRDGEGREITSVLAQPKRLAVLAYLAANRPRGFQRRDKVIGLFWPELDQARARQALNKTVHHLRRFIGAEAITSRGDEELSLDESLIRCDVWQFDRAIADGDHDAALELYRGGFADGLYVVDSPEVEQWLALEREYFRSAATSAAAALADGTSAPSDAIRWAQRALELSPADERALRRLMLAFERAGDDGGAVRAYNDFARRLEAELDASPSAESRALRARIAEKSASMFAALPSPATTPTSAASPPIPIPVASATPASPRAARSRIPMMVAAVCGLAAIVAVVIGLRRHAPSAAMPVDSHRVLMLPIENRTGDSSLALVGQMASDWIVEGLTAANIAEVVGRGEVSAKPTLANAKVVARETGAKTAIVGAYYKRTDSVQFQLQVIDATDGRVARVFSPVTAPLLRPDLALESLRQQAMTILSQESAPQLSVMLRGAPPTYAAYREYMEGVELYAQRERVAAYDHFIRAAQMDTSFDESLLSAATAAEFTEKSLDSLLRVLERRRQSLSATSALWLSTIEAGQRGDAAEWNRLAGDLSRLLPSSFYPYRYASSLLLLGKVHAAHDAIRRVDPTTGWMKGWYAYWVTRTMIDHLLGDTKAEQKDVVAGDLQYPHNVGIATAAAFYIGSTGDSAQVDSLFDQSLILAPVAGWNAASVFAVAGREAAAHGRDQLVPRIRERAVTWYNALPAEERAVEAQAYGLSWMLYSVQAWPELARRISQLAPKTSDLQRVEFEGMVAAQRGDTVGAARASALLRAPRGRPGVDDYLGLARIAALLGQRDSAIVFIRGALAHPAPDGVGQFGGAIYLHNEPAFHRLLSDPEFRALVGPKD